MQQFKNEQGYTLLLTLILCVIIALFFSTVSLGAINQQKQVKKTDASFEATALAEMGLEYYRAKVIDLTIEQGKLLRQELLDNENNFISRQKTEEEIRNKHSDALVNSIEALQAGTVEVNPANKESKKFRSNKALKVENSSIPIEVQGEFSSKVSKLNATFKIPDNLVQRVTYDNSAVLNDTKARLIIFPTPSSIITPTGKFDLNNHSNKTMWVKNNSIILNTNGPEKTYFVNLHLTGTSTFEDHMMGTDINIYSSNDLIFNKYASLTDSKIETKGLLYIDFQAGGPHTEFKGSLVLAEGITINPAHQLYLSKGTKFSTRLCIRDKNKALNLDKIVFKDKDSFVYVLDNGTPIIYTNPNIKYVSNQEFKTNCWQKDYTLNIPNIDNFATKIDYVK